MNFEGSYYFGSCEKTHRYHHLNGDELYPRYCITSWESSDIVKAIQTLPKHFRILHRLLVLIYLEDDSNHIKISVMAAPKISVTVDYSI